MTRRAGFTLIEVVACIALLVILCTIAAVSLRAQLGRGGLELAVEQIRLADAQARERARRSGQEVRVRFDRIARLYVAGRRAEGREAVVICSARGYTPSYAVLVEAEQQQWVVVAGLTGAIRMVADERSVEEILSTGTSAASDDAR